MLLPLLPSRCSDLIKEHGIPLNRWNPGSEEVALDREVALKVLEALAGSNIAVIGGEVVCITQGRLKYVYAQWSSARNAGENSLEFSKRSQRAAQEYITNFRPTGDYQPLFVLVLSALQD